jgi:hypothetical protein
MLVKGKWKRESKEVVLPTSLDQLIIDKYKPDSGPHRHHRYE